MDGPHKAAPVGWRVLGIMIYAAGMFAMFASVTRWQLWGMLGAATVIAVGAGVYRQAV
jgi:hypothetical protein